MASSTKLAIKALRDRALASLSAHRWKHEAGSLLVLTYHRVLPRDDERLRIVEPGMVVHEDTFDAHLAFVKREFDVLRLADWVDAACNNRPLPKRSCAITFDDGWQDNYAHAFPILKHHGLPATVFVVAGMVGTRYRFWPERMAAMLADGLVDTLPREDAACAWLIGIARRAGCLDGGATPDRISAAIAIAKALPDAQVHANLDAVEAVAGIAASTERDLCSWEELREMTEAGVFDVGSHTLHHVRLAEGLPDEQVQEEVAGSAAMIAKRLGRAPQLFCYPNGDVSVSARGVVEQNYLGACTTETGWNPPDRDRWGLRRYTMHEGSAATPAAFAARISGLL